MKAQVIEGTVPRGTLRPYDLFHAFADALSVVHPEAYQQAMFPACGFHLVRGDVVDDENHPWWKTDDALDVVDMLSEALNEAAPKGYYFGAHPGDRSDLGFWKEESDSE